VDSLKGKKMLLIPKNNSTLNCSVEWKSMIKDFLLNIVPHLEQNHQRSNSGSGFAADEKMLGHDVAQRTDDRIYREIF
jgi:transposase